MAKKILTLGGTAPPRIAPPAEFEAPAAVEAPAFEAPVDLEREEPPSAYSRYSRFARQVRPRAEGQLVVVSGVEMGFGRMFSLAMRWVLAYLLAIAVVAAIGGIVFVAGALILRSVS